MRAQAAGGELEDVSEHSVGHTDGSREVHVTRRRIDRAFRHKRDDRRNERISQVAGDPLCGMADDIVVFAQHHMRAILLDAAGRNDDGAHTLPNCLVNLDPGEFLKMNRVGQGCADGNSKREHSDAEGKKQYKRELLHGATSRMRR